MAQIWRKLSALGGAALLLVAAQASPAVAGTTYTVANVAELQAAIANVNAGVGGDLIVLGQGTYSLTGPLGYIFKDVTIQGDPAGTIVRGDGSFSIFSIRANNVSIENLTVQDAFTAISYEGASTFSGTGLTLTGSFYGIYFGDSRGTSNLTNSTITNNTFGVKVDCAGFNLTNVTVTGNEAGIDFASCGEQMGITNSLIVANGVDCTQWGAITPVGAASFDSDGTCVARGWPGMTTVALASLALQSLASNGGPTQTAAISPHSAAVDAGNNAACPTTDQRGRPRNDGFCDIGAYEAVSAAAGRDYFVATPDELAAAIFDAKNSSGRDRIFLAPVVFPINSSTIHSVRLLVDDSNGPNDIKLIGAGAAATILEGGGPADRNDVVTIDGSSLITIEKMTIENGGGFGIYNNGNLVLRDVIVRNHAGMGIQSVNAGLAIFGSTISGNGAALNGACCEAAIYVESTFSAVNTTIAGNPTTGLFIASTGGGASLLNVTIDGNAGAGLAVVNGPITITNTIVADNAGGDCDSSIASHATLGGPNLFGDGSCGFGASGSARLGPLQDNGGPTPTMELLAGSPAIDAAGAACVVTDQRGIARPQGGACDIGAFELVPGPVNSAPTCVDYTGSTFSGGPPGGAVSCSDPDAGDTFTVALKSGASNGVLALYSDGSFTYLPNSGFVGIDSFTFQATDSLGLVSNVATATITVSPLSTTTSLLTTSLNPVLFGAAPAITFQAFVTPATATGTVTFTDGATTLGTATIASGFATIDVTSLTPGTHLITAIYNGDAANTGSASAVLSLSLLPGTATVLTSSPNPSTAGEPVTFTATVTGTGATPTGTVTFGFSTMVPLVGGVASYTTSGLTAGTVQQLAEYNGDSQNWKSTSNILTQVVRAPTTTSLLTTSLNPVLFGAAPAITLQSFVTPATATGTVTFTDGATTLGTATIASGFATIDVTSLTPGTHLITAAYNGDGANTASTSAVLSLSLLPGTTTVLTSSPNPSTAGEPVTFTATVTGTGATPTGTVAFGSTIVPLVGGVASYTTSALTAGTFQQRAEYSGDSQNWKSTSNFITQTVRAFTTTSLLTTSYNPTLFVAGAPITFQAFVTPATATGTVTFMEGATTLGTATIASNYATIDVTSLTLGTHLITAIYNGDAANTESTSAVLSLILLPGTTTVLTSSPNPSTAGEPVTFTATVTGTGATPTGTVKFGFSTAVPLVGGVASLTLSGLTAGTFDQLAEYNGDSQNWKSTSNFITQTVRAVTTTRLVTTSFNPTLFVAGAPITFQAFVTPATATGTVTYVEGATTLGTATIASGAATIDVTGLTLGTHLITAIYNGDAANTGSASAVLSLSLLPGTATVLTSSPNPSTAGEPVTFTATVTGTGATPTGTVTFGFSTMVPLVGGVASYTTSGLTAGTVQQLAEYNGDSQNWKSTSNILTQVVRAPTTTSLLTTSLNPVLFGAAPAITFQSFVTPATATGTVTFQDGATTLGTATIASGFATIDVTSLTPGTHLITAAYNGDGANTASTSAVLSLSLLPGTTTVLTSSPNPSTAGEPVTFTATVTGTGATPTGTVAFGSTIVPLVGGVASYTTSALTAGTFQQRAEYSGDSQNWKSSSNFITQTVRALTSTSLITWSLNPAQAGWTLPLIATVTPATATGTVTFKDGITTLGTGTISGGVAMFDQPGLPVGTHLITAVYNGDAANVASTSPALSLVVNKAPTTTSVTSSGSPSIAGVPVTFTATVTGASPTGVVSFKADGTIALCSNTPLNGAHQASCSTSSLTAGTHAISASYAGDSNNLASVGSLSGFQVVNTGTGANITVSPDPAVSLTFSNISVAGITTAVSSTTAPPTPSGFQVPAGSLYWEISTTATYTPPIVIEVCIVAPTGVTNPRLLHYQGGAWVDVTTRMNGGFVCGNVTSLSPFVVAVPVQSTDVATQLQQLQTMVESFNLRKPATKKFIHRLDELQDTWAQTRHPKKTTKEFCKDLDKFMRDVEKAPGKTLTAAEAAQLLALAQLIAGEVGCGF